MAEKSKKRKLFDLPKVDELDEVVEVKSVFSRQKQGDKQAPVSTKNTKRTTIGQNAVKQNTPTEQLELQQPNEERLRCISNDSERKSDLECPTKAQNTEKNKKDNEGVVQVGRNFLETFAFIEDTKFYEEPKPMKPADKTTASSTSGAVSSAGTNMGQNNPIKTSKPNAVIVNQRQKGNPLLKFFQNVPWEYGDIIPDYVMGARMCALFLSIRYHNFNPNYIHERLKQLGNRYELRILLVQIDIKDPHKTLKELTKIAILADCTLILAWSAEEAARYIEMYKIYENKPPDALQGQSSTDYMSKLSDCLTTVKSVNKTDAITLISTFQTLENIISASKDDMALCPGFGPLKAKRLHDAFHQPFIVNSKKDSSDTSKT